MLEARVQVDERSAASVTGQVSDPQAGAVSAPLLEAVTVAKTFGATRALRDASFELRAGEVHALVG
ncbi:MAG TPA: hypothetical protein VGG41_06345, partial [Solirubrobacteraceae bacterium]